MNDRLRHELETELRRLMGVWFPRSVDRDEGGFFCDFDHRWRAAGAQPKMLEYQARQTIAAARGAAYHDLAPLREVALHGFRYLRDRMWDHTLGGWYRLLDRTGVPLESETKHGHGSSYAISACVACYQLEGDPECLALAKSAFTWLDEHAHDNRHGGYFVFYQRDGSPILSSDQGAAPGQSRDAIGTPIGCKDMNTTTDLLKCFAELYRAWPDALLRTRLEEMLSLVRDRLVVAPGLLHMYAHPDWTPLPDLVRYGQILRSANVLLVAAEALMGAVDASTERVAKSMIDTMLRIAWDPDKGGFYLAGSSFGRRSIVPAAAFGQDKPWWPQADGMRVLLTMARRHPADTAGYGTHFMRLWEYVKTYVIDAKRGGWLAEGRDVNPKASKWPKATQWKDASHETEALVDSLLMLNGQINLGIA